MQDRHDSCQSKEIRICFNKHSLDLINFRVASLLSGIVKTSTKTGVKLEFEVGQRLQRNSQGQLRSRCIDFVVLRRQL